MGRVELHAVGADLLGVAGSLDEGLLEFPELSLRGGAAERLTRMREAGRAQRDEIRVALRVPAVVDRALVPELQEHGAARLVDTGHARPPRFARVGRDPRERRVLRGARMIDGARLGNNQRGAAKHAAAVVLAQPEVRGAVSAPVALHSRHDEPVPQSQAANLERLEERGDVVVGRRYRRLVKLGHAHSPSAAPLGFCVITLNRARPRLWLPCLTCPHWRERTSRF